MTTDAHAGRGRRTVTVHGQGSHGSSEDWLAEEAPVEVRYNGEPFAVMMATPVDLEDFAHGFSLSEGLIDSVDGIHGVDVQARLEGFVVDIDAPSVAIPESGDARLLPGRSGCGLCGSRRLEDVLQAPAPVADGPLPGQRRLAAREPGSGTVPADQRQHRRDARGGVGITRRTHHDRARGRGPAQRAGQAARRAGARARGPARRFRPGQQPRQLRAGHQGRTPGRGPAGRGIGTHRAGGGP